jgi:hypothetical protein
VIVVEGDDAEELVMQDGAADRCAELGDGVLEAPTLSRVPLTKALVAAQALLRS